MASAVELLGGRDGNTVGVDGGSTFTRMFHVTVDDVNDPPTFVLRLPSLVGRAAVPPGAPFPAEGKDGVGMFAARYTQTATLDHLNYMVRVDYAPPSSLSPLDRGTWQYTQSPGLGTDEISEAVIVGGGNTKQTIGPQNYEKNETGATHHTRNSNPEAVLLKKLPGRRAQPAQRDISAGTFTLSRTIGSLSLATLGTVAAYEGHLNRQTFYGRPPFTVKYGGAAVSSEVGVQPGQAVEGVIWNIQLTFEYRSISFFHQVQDVYVDNDLGETTPVIEGTSGNKVVVTEYQLDPDIVFDVILNAFEAHA